MNASENSLAFGLSFLASGIPNSYEALADAVNKLYADLHQKPKGMAASLSNGKIIHRAYSPKTLREAVLEPSALEVHLGDVTNLDDVIVDCFLRPIDPTRKFFGDRWIAVTGPTQALQKQSLQAFLMAVVDIYPIVQGGLGGYRSHAQAARESSLSGAFSPSEVDAHTRERLREDAMLSGQFLRRLRRLYPVTIIGPEIWAQLSPMPAIDPPPKVEDLGNCKMVTAWPELVEPRDPAFLAGTKELRRWLWPFTIQNPADAIDAPPPEPVPEPFF
ncbi:MAG: hypothetical protein WKG01_30530 [Kofleriaceae bacterium]